VKWGIQLLSWASTVIVARILSPSDFGLMGMATVYLGLIALINEFGLTAAVLRGRELGAEQLAQLGGFGVCIGAAFTLASMIAAFPVAAFYGEPAVRTIILVLSLNFVLTSLGVLPRALLARDLRFQVLAAIDGAANVVQIAATLVLAILGLRYLALVFGSLLASVTGATLALAIRGHRLAWPRSFRSISDSVRVGWHVVVGRLAWYTYQNADFAIVGRVLGKAVLGTYTLGWEIATVPVERVSALVGQVTPGIFSAVQSDRPLLRRYYLAVVQGLSFITFPAAAGLTLTAPVLIPVVLGEHWRPAIIPLQLLAVYGGIRSVDTVTPQVLIYTGHSRQSMWYTVLAACVLPMLFLLGTHFGAAGVAAMWIVGYPIVISPIYRIALRILDLSPRMYLRNLWPAGSSTIAMACAVLAVRYTLARGAVNPVVALAAEVATGVVVYTAILLLVHRDRVRAFVTLVRRARGGSV
jgi:O-antigen/teichoic acid export membrane protein